MAETIVHFPGRVGLQQRVLPDYRIPFFDQLSTACSDGLALYAGWPRPAEAIQIGNQPKAAMLFEANNRHWLSGPFYLLRQPGLMDWLKSWQPDVLVLEANLRYLDNWRALAWAHRQNIPVIGWGLGAPGLNDGGLLPAWLWRRFLNQFQGLIAYSSKGAREYQSTQVPADRIFVATNAAVGKPPEPVVRPASAGEPLRLLFVGRLQPRKGVDRLLQACAELADSVELRIVGDGPDGDRLKVLAGKILPKAVFAGHQHGEPLRESFAWADLFVLPGTGGLAVQQAMAHGLPVVVAEGDGTQADLVRAGNGWLIEADSILALRAAIERALEARDKLRAMGEMSATIVRDEVNVQAMVKTFVEAFRAVVGDVD